MYTKQEHVRHITKLHNSPPKITIERSAAFVMNYATSMTSKLVPHRSLSLAPQAY